MFVFLLTSGRSTKLKSPWPIQRARQGIPGAGSTSHVSCSLREVTVPGSKNRQQFHVTCGIVTQQCFRDQSHPASLGKRSKFAGTAGGDDRLFRCLFWMPTKQKHTVFNACVINNLHPLPNPLCLSFTHMNTLNTELLCKSLKNFWLHFSFLYIPQPSPSRTSVYLCYKYTRHFDFSCQTVSKPIP